MTDRRTLVLYIDDDAVQRLITQTCLKHYGYAPLLADSGPTGISLARQHHPDLILLDIMLPGVSGQDILSLLKDSPETRRIPVIALSALSDVETRLAMFAHGAVDFLTKPFDPRELEARIRIALHHRRP